MSASNMECVVVGDGVEGHIMLAAGEHGDANVPPPNTDMTHGVNAGTAVHRMERELPDSIEDSLGGRPRRDPVGETIARLLNQGKIPGFGYDGKPDQTQQEGFKLIPVLSARNFRAVKRILGSLWEGYSSDRAHNMTASCGEGGDSVWFIFKILALCYVVVYSLNDIVIRSVAELFFISILGTIASVLVDYEEVKCGVVVLVDIITPSFIKSFAAAFAKSVSWIIARVEHNYLWGGYFQGRVQLWSDEGRLEKFRRKHRRLMANMNDQKRNKRDRNKSKAERMRREKLGWSFTSDEMAKMKQEIWERDRIEITSKELVRCPPTFFPEKLAVPKDPRRQEESSRHLDALQFCHRMVLLSERQQNVQVSISMDASDGHKCPSRQPGQKVISPRESIEVQFPKVGIDSSKHSRLASDTSFMSFSDASTNAFDHLDDEQDNDDELSIGTYTSESTAQSMPWMLVGAKITHKLLNSRKLQRVIANPDAAQNLLPEDAKMLIDSAKKEITPTKASTLDGAGSFKDQLSLSVSEVTNTSPSDVELKKPVHGMWTDAGAVASTPRANFGAFTLASSPNRPQDKIEEGVEGVIQLNSFQSRSQQPLQTITLMTQTPTTLNLESAPTPLQNNTSRRLFGGLVDRKQSSSLPPSMQVTRLAPIEAGVKIVVPLFPPNIITSAEINDSSFYQMGTVLSSHRISTKSESFFGKHKTDCLAIHLLLDKALLRGSKFAEMNVRILDEWNYVPRHSKYPIGSCVATTFGVGVLVGWRVEDDMHVIRSLWKRNGPGSGLAYLRRDSVHSVVEAAVGFDVETSHYGPGSVVAYVKGGRCNTSGRYLVRVTGRYRIKTVEMKRNQIMRCHGATFVPITEHIRAAAQYRLQVLCYKAKLREQMLNNPSRGVREKGMWRHFSEYIDLFANSFSKAISEDPDFDKEVDKLVSHIINLLDENIASQKSSKDEDIVVSDILEAGLNGPDSATVNSSGENSVKSNESDFTAGWNMNDLFGNFFMTPAEEENVVTDNLDILRQTQAFEDAHDSVEILIRVLVRTVTVARSSVPNRPKLHMALAVIHEGLLFVRQVLRVQRKHTSKRLVEAWFRALNELSNTFGPLKKRGEKLGVRLAKRFKKHGNVAKKRILRFVDIILSDTQLLFALELGDWRKALTRLEVSIVKASVTDATTVEQMHKGIAMMYKNLAPRKRDHKSRAAANRNTQKAVNFAKLMKVVASPGRSLLRLLTLDDVLLVFDRILVRVFEKDPHCSMVINIWASTFHSIRHLRTLNNMEISGRLWKTVLDAIDEELSFAISEIPQATKDFVEPFVKLFSLGVSQFHLIQSGSSNDDWLDFLLADDAVGIIEELDLKFIASLEGFCKDIKQVVQVLPYIKTIDNDILDLMDEFDFDLLLKEISDSIGDAEKLKDYITDRSTVLVERFLDYLPRMSIPIERIELQDGWVLTCRGKDGGDLRLSDISVARENLLCRVAGSSDNVFHPITGKSSYVCAPKHESPRHKVSPIIDTEGEPTVLNDIFDLILSAKSHGNWVAGMGDLKDASHFDGVPYPLNGLPLSNDLKMQIDLWQTSAISDFELLQTAIREVSKQIQLHKDLEESGATLKPKPAVQTFNPSVDPTLLFLDIKKLTLCLHEFGFRIEKECPTIFDPVFEGSASIQVKNVSITLKVEIKKENVLRQGNEVPVPVLQLAKYEVGIEHLQLEFMDTGADWLLNSVLNGLSLQITTIVQDNLKDQLETQVQNVLEQVNNLVDSNPELLLNVLGITINELDENIVCI